MRKMKTNLVVGGNGGVNHETLAPPAPPVPVTKFEPPTSPALPPPPPQFNNPVGPPPQQDALAAAVTVGDFVALAKKAGAGAMTDKAQIWATLAMALATERQAKALEELLRFTQTSTGEDEDDVIPSRFSEAIADGVLMAVKELPGLANELQSRTELDMLKEEEKKNNSKPPKPPKPPKPASKPE